MNKNKLWKLCMLSFLALALFCFVSEVAHAAQYYESYDGVTSGSFTNGTVGTTYKYNTTNGYRAPLDSGSQQFQYPTYIAISLSETTYYEFNFTQMAYIVDAGSNQYYGMQGIQFYNAISGLNKTIFISPDQTQAFPKTTYRIFNDTYSYVATQTGCTGIFANNWVQEILTIRKVSANQFNVSGVIKNSGGTVLCTIPQTTITDDVIAAATNVRWGSKDGHGSGSPGYRFDEVYVDWINITAPSSNLSFVSPTPANNSVQYYTNNSFIINTSTSNIGGSINTTHFLYYENGSLAQSHSSLAENYLSTFTALSVGRYFFNATAQNSTNTTSTETRLITIYNITPGAITAPSSGQNITEFLNVSWTNGTTTNNSVNINNFRLMLLNSDLSFNRTLNTTGALSSNMYNLYLNNLTASSYYLHVEYNDTNGNKQNGTPVLFNHPTNALLNITGRLLNGSIRNNFTIELTDLTSYETRIYNTTGGVVSIDIIRGRNYSAIFNTTEIATTDPFTETNYGSEATIRTNQSAYQSWTQYLPLIMYDIVFSRITNVTVRQESSLTGLNSYENVTSIQVNASSYEQDKYIVISFGNDQQYTIYNTQDEYRNISLYVTDMDSVTTVSVISSGSPVPDARVELYEATGLFGNTLRAIYSTTTEASGYADILFNSGTIAYTIVVSKEGYETKTKAITIIAGSTIIPTINLIRNDTGEGISTIYTNCYPYGELRTCEFGVYTTKRGQTVFINWTGQNGYSGSSETTSIRTGRVYEEIYINETTQPVLACGRIEGDIVGCRLFAIENRTQGEEIYNNGTVEIQEPEGIDDTRENLVVTIVVLTILLIIIFGYLEGIMDGLGMSIVGILSFIFGFRIHPIFIAIGILIGIYYTYTKFRKAYTTN